MAVISSASNPSTSTSSVVDKVKELSQTLYERGAKDGAKRLEVVAQHYQHFTVEGASQYLRRDEIVEELDNQPQKLLSVLRFFRNVLSIAPIVMTWVALGFAATAYQSDLNDTRHYPNDLYQPFLRLWQDGFHGNHGFVISFSLAAGIDAFLLTWLVIFIAAIPILEWRHRNKLYESLTDSDNVIDDLLALIGQDGANSHLAESDVNKISRAIEAVLKNVMMAYRQVAVETGNLVKDAHQKAIEAVESTNQSTQSLVKNFESNLAVFNSDVMLLNGGLQKLDGDLGSYGQKLTELTEASNKLAGSSTDLALNAKSMAESATLSSQASQGISTQLGALNTAQQEIVTTQKQVANTIAQSQQQVADTIKQTQGDVVTKISQTQDDVVKQFTTTQQSVVQEIERTQKNVVKDITGVADKMDESSKNTLDVSKQLEDVVKSVKQFTQADLQVMTNQVSNAANQVDRIAASLNASAKALDAAAGKTRGPAKSLTSKLVFPLAATTTIAVIGEIAWLIFRLH